MLKYILNVFIIVQVKLDFFTKNFSNFNLKISIQIIETN